MEHSPCQPNSYCQGRSYPESEAHGGTLVIFVTPNPALFFASVLCKVDIQLVRNCSLKVCKWGLSHSAMK